MDDEDGCLMILAGFLGVVIATVARGGFISALLAAPAMWAWNVIVPPLFNGPTITFVQAFGGLFILALARGVFK